jgi:serine/threonine protein kinase
MALTAARDLSFLDHRIRKQLIQLDLNGRIQSKTPYAAGYGAFSDVYQGTCKLNRRRSNVRVAMKQLRMQLASVDCKNVSFLFPLNGVCAGANEHRYQLFEKEIYVWSKLKHDNVLPLLGFAFAGDSGFPMLISEWMDNGNALAYVIASEPSPRELVKLVSSINFSLSHNL